MNITLEKSKIQGQADELVIRVPFTPESTARLSSTGKNKIAYSSGGFKYENGLGVSLNVIHSKR